MSGQLRGLIREVVKRCEQRGLGTAFNRNEEKGVYYFEWIHENVIVAEFVVDPSYIVNISKWADQLFQIILLGANNIYGLSNTEIMNIKYFASIWEGEDVSVMSIRLQDINILDQYQRMEEAGLIGFMMGDTHIYFYLSEEGYQYAKNLMP